MSAIVDKAPREAAGSPFRFTLRGLMLFVFFCGVTFALLFQVALPAYRAARESAQQQECINKLKQIGIALQNYHQVYGCFPAPHIADSTGKPMHSWRIAIVDYIEQLGVHWRYDFNRPWDDPANLQMTRSYAAANFFGCPSGSQPPSAGVANYVMIVGAVGPSQPGKWSSMDEINACAEETIIVAEITDSDIFWAEPRDISFDELSLQINDKSKRSISSHHRHGALVLLANGEVKFLDESTSPKVLRAMLTCAAND
jgi:hypothetical protein